MLNPLVVASPFLPREPRQDQSGQGSRRRGQTKKKRLLRGAGEGPGRGWQGGGSRQKGASSLQGLYYDIAENVHPKNVCMYSMCN